MSAKVAIVGAGISGLAAARALLREGYEVQVFEASDRPGGLLGTDASDGFLVDRAASSFIPASDGAVALAQELGVEMEEASSKSRNRWVFIDGDLQRVPTTARQLLTSPLLSWRGKFRALAEPLQPNLPGADESIAEFCRRRLGSEVTRGLIAPFVTGVFGGDAEVLSLRACFPSLAALEARGGLLRGAAATKVEAVFSRMQGAATAKRGRRILAPVGGVESLVRALGETLEEAIEYETSIASIECEESGLTLHCASGAHHRVDSLVLATPASVSASLVHAHQPAMAQALRDIPYAPMVVVALGFETAPSAELDGFGYLVAKGESVRTLGVAFESSVWSGRAPAGGALLRCMMGGARDPAILELSDEEIIAVAREDLKTTLSLAAEPTFTKVIRWPRALPQYTIGHLKRETTIQEGAEALGLVVAGNAIGGVSVNDCIKNAATVVKKVSQRLASSSALVLLAVALSSALGACGASSKKTDGLRDAGAEKSRIEVPDASTVAEPSLPTNRGKVEVMARWLWPPAEMRRSPGRNSCGVARAPALRVELMGGLANTALSTTVGSAPTSAVISISQCLLQPPLVVMGVGESLHLQNLDESAHTIVVEELDDLGTFRKKLGLMPMRVVGQQYSLRAEQRGVLRVHLASNPEDFAYALVRSGAAQVGSKRGMAELELPVGKHPFELWHAPVGADAKAVVQNFEVLVQSQVRKKRVVDLNP